MGRGVWGGGNVQVFAYECCQTCQEGRSTIHYLSSPSGTSSFFLPFLLLLFLLLFFSLFLSVFWPLPNRQCIQEYSVHITVLSFHPSSGYFRIGNALKDTLFALLS